MIARTAVFVVMVAGVPAHGAAQTCRGGAPIERSRPALATAAFARTPGLSNLNLRVGGGGDLAFATVGVGVRSYRTLDVKTWSAGFVVGGQFAATDGRTLMMCPFGGANYEDADDVLGPGIEALAVQTEVGVSLGVVAYGTSALQIVPTGGLSLISENIRGSGVFNNLNGRDTFGTVEFGVGVVYRRVALTPTVARSLARDGDTRVRIVFGYGFGGQR